MEERVYKIYHKEEEFLEWYGDITGAAVKLLANEWTPNYDANDETRRNIDYFLARGESRHLSFDMAAVYHNRDGFSSVQIVLKSSFRSVSVRVKKDNDKYLAEIISDKRLSDQEDRE